MPYIKRAQALGYEVIVTNTNDLGRKGVDIPGCEKPEEHFKTVWKEIVQPANAKSIALVGHSYGGWVLCHVGEFFKDDYKNRVFAAALTDSVHRASGKGARMTEIGVNFVSSEKAVGTPITSEYEAGIDMPRVSAGTKKHEMTSVCYWLNALVAFYLCRVFAIYSTPASMKCSSISRSVTKKNEVEKLSRKSRKSPRMKHQEAQKQHLQESPHPMKTCRNSRRPTARSRRLNSKF